MHCRSCGMTLIAPARFCSSCGRQVDPAPAARPVFVTTSTTSLPPLPREDLAAAVAVRNELGDRMEPAVVEAFIARIEHAVTARVDAHLSQRLHGLPRAHHENSGALPLAICSLVFGIPLTAIAAGIADLPGLVACWAGIAAINLAHGLREKQR
jgi:hypothetical protein